MLDGGFQPQAQLPLARGGQLSSAVLCPSVLALGARAGQVQAQGPTPPQASGWVSLPDSWLGPSGFGPLISVTRWLWPLSLSEPGPKGTLRNWAWSVKGLAVAGARCSPGAFLSRAREHVQEPPVLGVVPSVWADLGECPLEDSSRISFLVETVSGSSGPWGWRSQQERMPAPSLPPGPSLGVNSRELVLNSYPLKGHVVDFENTCLEKVIGKPCLVVSLGDVSCEPERRSLDIARSML